MSWSVEEVVRRIYCKEFLSPARSKAENDALWNINVGLSNYPGVVYECGSFCGQR